MHASVLDRVGGPLLVRPRAGLALGLSLALVGLIAFADYVTGYEVRLAILYLGPIAWATWRVGKRVGAAIAVLSVVTWIFTFASNHPYTSAFYFYMEGAIQAVTFLLFVMLLARLQRALERSDERFVTVLEGLDAAVQVHEAPSGATLFENAKYRDAFGAARAFTQESGEIHDVASRRWYLLRSRPLRWTDGRPAVLRVLSDITDERVARELIQRHHEEVHRTSRLVALGEFASAIAHELNQPLAAIATYNSACMRLLERKDCDPAELADAIAKCREQAKRAGAIIQRLREMLRQPTPAASPQDLNEMARIARDLAEAQALQAGVELELDLAPALPQVRTDRLLVEQVALNLMRNAIEAVHDLPAERRRVAISTAPGASGEVTFRVSDRGRGVDAGIAARLFEPFVTSKASGLGLGLSICRSVIESLGGTIRHEPGAGGGATFAFTLPAIRK